MMQATSEKDTITSIIGSVNQFVSEAVLEFDENGLYIEAIDAADVGLCEVRSKPEAFESYTSDKHRMGVNTDRMQKMIDLTDSDELVELEFDGESRDGVLTIRAGDNLEFTLGLIRPDSVRDVSNPDLKFPVSFKVVPNEFYRLVEGAQKVSDQVTLSVTDNEFSATAAGAENDFEYKPFDDGIEYPEGFDVPDVTSQYSLDYLHLINSVVPDDTMVELSFGDGMPIEVVFTVGEYTRVRYLLAPRLES